MMGDISIWHASLIEMIWTFMGLVGCYFGGKNLSDSKRTIEALKYYHTKEERKSQVRMVSVIAYGHFRNDLFRFCKHLTVTFVGLVAMLLPPVPPNHPQKVTTATGVVVTLGLFTIVLLAIMSSILDNRQRDALEAIYEEDRTDRRASESREAAGEAY